MISRGKILGFAHQWLSPHEFGRNKFPPEYKYIVQLIMGNFYRVMVTITLTCRLHHEIEVNSEAFTVDVCTSDRINKLKDKIFAKLKEKKDDTFTNIEAYDMKLWKVNIPVNNQEKFSKLVLKNDEKESIKNLWGIISDYWNEQPSNDFIHVIIDSPTLKIENLTRKLNELRVGVNGRS